MKWLNMQFIDVSHEFYNAKPVDFWQRIFHFDLGRGLEATEKLRHPRWLTSSSPLITIIISARPTGWTYAT